MNAFEFFWKSLNALLSRQGLKEANWGEAHDAFRVTESIHEAARMISEDRRR